MRCLLVKTYTWRLSLSSSLGRTSSVECEPDQISWLVYCRTVMPPKIASFFFSCKNSQVPPTLVCPNWILWSVLLPDDLGKNKKKQPNQIAIDFGKAIEHTVRCAQVINLQRKTDPIYLSGVTFSSLFLLLGSIPIWGFQRPITISRKVECRSSLQSSSQVHRKLVIVCMAIRRAAEKKQKKAHETPHHLE